ncbi:Coa1/Tim21 domain-containing protein [Roseimaritima ulvae]|uniref:Cytochrome oxidase complex assembly protein 1 n=1 Tax=Roseimaritima ulvae TaxID=980254 RepID=A0A5B9QM55_9BACT|nr:hypothetical protein [Roseimaritima ulvae]QEG38912.1 hypothetical protein UC8_08700 [Roseimaritima ulvae]
MSQTPYAVTNDQQQPPKDNTLKIVLIVLGIVILAVMLVCGGIMAAGYFAVARVADEFQDAFSGGFAREYLEAPEAKEALGNILDTSFVMDMDEDEEDASGNLEIRVTGSKASGTLIIGSDEEGNELVQLVMDDGRIIDLPQPEYEDFEELDFDTEAMEIEEVEMDVTPGGN